MSLSSLLKSTDMGDDHYRSFTTPHSVGLNSKLLETAAFPHDLQNSHNKIQEGEERRKKREREGEKRGEGRS